MPILWLYIQRNNPQEGRAVYKTTEHAREPATEPPGNPGRQLTPWTPTRIKAKKVKETARAAALLSVAGSTLKPAPPDPHTAHWCRTPRTPRTLAFPGSVVRAWHPQARGHSFVGFESWVENFQKPWILASPVADGGYITCTSFKKKNKLTCKQSANLEGMSA